MREKALSIRQPWAHAIVHFGKNIENRDWKHAPSYRGPILIHASASRVRRDIELDLGVIEDIRDRCFSGWPDMRFGGIIGRARIVDVVRDHDSPWFFGPLGFVLADVEPLPFYRCKGALSFFDVDMSLPPDPEPVKASRIKVAKPSPVNQRRLF